MRNGAIVILSSMMGAHAAVAGPLVLDTAAGLQAEATGNVQPESPPPPPDAEPAGGLPPARVGFGRAGASYLGVGAGYSNDFDDNHGANVSFSYSHFIADELEFNLELNGWYFSQEGDDAGGISPVMNFRWHFLHDETYDWTIFGEAGIGLLFAFDNVPDGGTGFNFMPRLGAGFTKALDDEGTRLMLGVRWQHISNGRIEGDERNPGRDSLMVFAGIMIPF